MINEETDCERGFLGWNVHDPAVRKVVKAQCIKKSKKEQNDYLHARNQVISGETFESRQEGNTRLLKSSNRGTLAFRTLNYKDQLCTRTSAERGISKRSCRTKSSFIIIFSLIQSRWSRTPTAQVMLCRHIGFDGDPVATSRYEWLYVSVNEVSCVVWAPLPVLHRQVGVVRQETNKTGMECRLWVGQMRSSIILPSGTSLNVKDVHGVRRPMCSRWRF